MTVKYPYRVEQADAMAQMTNARVSVLQTKMVGKCVPSDSELEQIFQSALAVPDHGQIHPARFVVVTGDKLEDYIKYLYAEKIANNKNFPMSLTEFTKNFAGVGMFIVIYAKITEGKIEADEQEWSVAASVQNMLNLFYAYGFAAKWNSISKHRDEGIKKHLGVDTNLLSMGYLLIGKSADTAKIKTRKNYREHFRIL